jgi:alpha-glucosidase
MIMPTRPATTTVTAPSEPWWTGAVGYQVYLRSFADSDGDGIGDLEGLRRRLDHIAGLGVDYLWITPFYPSPQADHGYDVADYTDVDPAYGDLATFDRVVARAHRLGLRVVVDVVPNHSSDRHPWFLDATSSRDAAHRDHYVWRDPAPDGGPPNNWVSKFGGPAWTWHEATGQYYMHTFLAQQPDLNWANPAVHAAFEAILTFWLERGVDGFRIDTAHLLTEDPSFRDNPVLHEVAPGADAETVYHAFEHRHDLDQPDVLAIYRRWRELVAPYGALLLGEVGLFEPEPVGRYVADGALDLAFYFPALKVGWDAGAIRDELAAALAAGGDRLAWPLSSHDDPRATQRFGGGERGAARALAYLTVLVGLPGNAFLLQGDELGVDGTALTTADPERLGAHGVAGHDVAGRDVSRTPMPWDGQTNFGFTSGTPWLAFPDDTSLQDTVAGQEHGRSQLRRTRALLAERARLPDLRGDEELEWLEGPDALLAYRRGRTLIAMNTGGTYQPIPGGRDARARFVSTGEVRRDGDDLLAPPDAAVIAELRG